MGPGGYAAMAWYGVEGFGVDLSYAANRAGKTLALRDVVSLPVRRRAARGYVGRIENVRFVEGYVKKKKATRLSLEQRVALLEAELKPAPENGRWLMLSNNVADRIASLQRRVGTLETRAGDIGAPLYSWAISLSCGTQLTVVARILDEATAKAQAYINQSEHEATIVSVSQASSTPINVC